MSGRILRQAARRCNNPLGGRRGIDARPSDTKFALRLQDKSLRGVGKRIASACVGGIAQLEKEAVLPAHFNETALIAASNLIRIGQKDAGGLSIALDGDDPVTPTAQAVEYIREVVQKARVSRDVGTLEGTLDIVPPIDMIVSSYLRQ